MKTSHHGSFAVAALCAFLVACGGSGDTPPTVLPASVAIANDARADAGTPATFHTDVATNAGLTFRWDFGDGSSGSGATTSHAYAKPGTYTVTVAVANDAEELRTATSTIQVGAYANVKGLQCSQADSTGWCWQHALLTGHQINDVFFVDASHAWAVGNDLTLLKSADGGATWTPVPLDPTLPSAGLVAVRFYDGKHGMVLTDQGGALQTADGGTTWAPVSTSNISSGASSFVDYGPHRILVQSNNGNGALSMDGGSTWSYVGLWGPIQASPSDCWSVNWYAVQRAAGCSADTTTMLSNNIVNGNQSFVAGAFPSDHQALVVGYGYANGNYTWTAQAWASADAGATWTNFVPSGLPSYFSSGMALRMTDEQTGILYSLNDFTAYLTTDAGRDWTFITSSPSLAQASGYRATGVTVDGALWQVAGSHVSISTDRGQTWHDAVVHAEDAAVQAGLPGPMTVTQYSDANDFVVTISHRFYVTNDGGQSFRQVLGGDPRDAGAAYATVEFSDFHTGKVLTSNGALLSTADGGRTWTRLDYPTTTGTAVAMRFTSATEGWLVLGGKLAHSTDGGATWSTPLTDFGMTNLQGMSWGDAAHGWTWNNGQLFVTANAGVTWTAVVMPNGMSVSSAAMTGALTGVATGYYGSAATTQDGGVTWQAVVSPPALGTLVRTTGQTVWALNGYALQRSKDGGRTWQVAGPTNSYVTYSGIAFADDLHGWLISNGSVLSTIDGGDTWTSQPVGSDLALTAVVAVDPMTAWVVTRDGQILATATGGN